MAVRSKTQIVNNITNNLADNNAGLISAADIRNNMLDIVDSINAIVGSGNFDGDTPFSPNNVRAKIDTINKTGGFFIAESGIVFPNAVGQQTQIMPYPGPGGISHNTLNNLTEENPHTQYMSIDGINKAIGNMPMGNAWINSSGNLSIATNNRGFKFEYTTGASGEIIHVGSNSTIKFDRDNSYTQSGKGFAQAWISFNGSGTMSVLSSYNVSKLQKVNQGRYKVFFKPNTFANNLYVAVGNSNAVGGNGSAEDFDINTVGIVERDKDYVTFYVKSDDNEYVNAAVNDLVVFGNASGVTPEASPTIEIL